MPAGVNRSGGCRRGPGSSRPPPRQGMAMPAIVGVRPFNVWWAGPSTGGSAGRSGSGTSQRSSIGVRSRPPGSTLAPADSRGICVRSSALRPASSSTDDGRSLNSIDWSLSAGPTRDPPGDDDDITCSCHLIPAAIARRRSGWMTSRALRRTRRTSSMIVTGSSAPGLSDVSTATSARRGAIEP